MIVARCARLDCATQYVGDGGIGGGGGGCSIGGGGAAARAYAATNATAAAAAAPVSRSRHRLVAVAFAVAVALAARLAAFGGGEGEASLVFAMRGAAWRPGGVLLAGVMSAGPCAAAAHPLGPVLRRGMLRWLLA